MYSNELAQAQATAEWIPRSLQQGFVLVRQSHGTGISGSARGPDVTDRIKVGPNAPTMPHRDAAFKLDGQKYKMRIVTFRSEREWSAAD